MVGQRQHDLTVLKRFHILHILQNWFYSILYFIQAKYVVVHKQIRMLENRLDQANKKFNQALADNKNLRGEVIYYHLLFDGGKLNCAAIRLYIYTPMAQGYIELYIFLSI